MTRKIRALNGGRARIWWVHHRQEAARCLQLTALIAGFLVVSGMDYEDQLAAERARAAAAEARLAEIRSPEGFDRPLPRITFLLDASTPEELRERLAEIAGDLDGKRARLYARQK